MSFSNVFEPMFSNEGGLSEPGQERNECVRVGLKQTRKQLLKPKERRANLKSPSFCSFWMAKRGRPWRSPGLGLELEVVGPWPRLIISLSRVLAMLHGYFRSLLEPLPLQAPFYGRNYWLCVLSKGTEQTGLAGAWRRIFVPQVSGAVASEFCSKMAPVSRSLQLQGTTGNLPFPLPFQEQSPTVHRSGNQPSQWERSGSGDTSI